jgi:hypothetical protein
MQMRGIPSNPPTKKPDPAALFETLLGLDTAIYHCPRTHEWLADELRALRARLVPDCSWLPPMPDLHPDAAEPNEADR